MQASTKLTTIKIVHTIVWAFFVICIFAIPVTAHFGHFGEAGVFFFVVIFEVLILAANDGSCPLTPMAARYTSDRKPNFAIFLPVSIAKYNKIIFGAVYVGGSIYAVYKWWSGTVD